MDKRWRHVDFFEHRAFLAARVPRVECGQHGIHLVEVPWARLGSGFRLLMEAAMLTFAKQMPIAPLARMAREHDTRVWRVVEHHVRGAREGLDFSGVTDVGMDQTSARRGQDYVSIFMDLDQRRVMFATPGKGADTVKAFAVDLCVHGGRPQTQVERVCCDMSHAFIKGVNQYLSEQPAMRLKTTRAARWRDDFNGFYEQPTRQQAEAYLKRWCYGAKRSRLEPVKEFARMVEAHWEGIIAWQESQLNNRLLEGTNFLVQAAKRRARGYRSKDKMITIIYLIAGKLPLPEIHTI